MKKTSAVAVALTLLLISAASARMAMAAELLYVDRPNCPYCKAWEIEVGRVYDRTAESEIAPLRRIDIRDIDRTNYDFREPVLYTPTFVLLERGREIGRITGYSHQATFWGSLNALLNQLEPEDNDLRHSRRGDYRDYR